VSEASLINPLRQLPSCALDAARRNGRGGVSPAVPDVGDHRRDLGVRQFPTGQRAPLSTMGKTLLIALPGLSLPFVIRYTVIEGVATATEVSTIGVVYTALLGLLVYREFDWRRIYPILIETVSLSGAVMMIIGTATGMAWALTQSGFSLWLVSAMAAVPGGSWGFLAITIVAFIILGSVLEGLPAIVLFGPLLFPVAKSMGVHEVHYAMVVILAMGIGLFAPPFGVGFFSACAIHASRHRAAVLSDMKARSASVLTSILLSFARTRAARVYLLPSRSDDFDAATLVVFAISIPPCFGGPDARTLWPVVKGENERFQLDRDSVIPAGQISTRGPRSLRASRRDLCSRAGRGSCAPPVTIFDGL
jgi:hypothetical protein